MELFLIGLGWENKFGTVINTTQFHGHEFTFKKGHNYGINNREGIRNSSGIGKGRYGIISCPKFEDK